MSPQAVETGAAADDVGSGDGAAKEMVKEEEKAKRATKDGHFIVCNVKTERRQYKHQEEKVDQRRSEGKSDPS